MFRDKIFSEAARQLACDYNCSAADFDRSDGRASLAVKADGQRRFTEKPIFFRAATFGKNAVISCAEEVLPFAEDIKSMGVTLFDGKAALDAVLSQHGGGLVAFSCDVGKCIGMLFQVVGEVQHGAFFRAGAAQNVDHVVGEVEAFLTHDATKPNPR